MVSVGHCHPGVVSAIRAQAEKLLIVPGRYQSRPALNLARRLAAYAGGKLKRTFFVNSGAEAVEGAVKLCIEAPRAAGSTRQYDHRAPARLPRTPWAEPFLNRTVELEAWYRHIWAERRDRACARSVLLPVPARTQISIVQNPMRGCH